MAPVLKGEVAPGLSVGRLHVVRCAQPSLVAVQVAFDGGETTDYRVMRRPVLLYTARINADRPVVFNLF
jgi:hypothetical protein